MSDDGGQPPLPIGVQLVGRIGGEAQLLAAAALLEAALADDDAAAEEETVTRTASEPAGRGGGASTGGGHARARALRAEGGGMGVYGGVRTRAPIDPRDGGQLHQRGLQARPDDASHDRRPRDWEWDGPRTAEAAAKLHGV